MRIMLMLLCSSLLWNSINAQRPSSVLGIYAYYGLENNYGNSVYCLGMKYEKAISKKWIYSLGVSRFTIGNYNRNRETESFFDMEERYYKSWFLTPCFGFSVLETPNSFFQFKLRAGPSLNLFNYKVCRQALVRYYPDGKRELVQGTDKYYMAKGANISFYAGTSLDFTMSKKITMGLLLDTYSHEIMLEHFMPGVYVSYKLQ